MCASSAYTLFCVYSLSGLLNDGVNDLTVIEAIINSYKVYGKKKCVQLQAHKIE